MAVLKPLGMAAHVSGIKETHIEASTVGELLEQFTADHDGLRELLRYPDGRWRPYFRVLVNRQPIEDLQGMDTPLRSDDVVTIVSPISGG